MSHEISSRVLLTPLLNRSQAIILGLLFFEGLLDFIAHIVCNLAEAEKYVALNKRRKGVHVELWHYWIYDLLTV